MTRKPRPPSSEPRAFPVAVKSDPSHPSILTLTQPIAEARRTDTPRYGMAADGYTARSGAPTGLLLRLEGEKRWRRLMVLQFSNAGSVFLRIAGEVVHVHEYDIPETRAAD